MKELKKRIRAFVPDDLVDDAATAFENRDYDDAANNSYGRSGLGHPCPCNIGKQQFYMEEGSQKMKKIIERYAKIRKMLIEFDKSASFLIENTQDAISAIDKPDFHYLAGLHLVGLDPKIRFVSIADLRGQIDVEIESFEKLTKNKKNSICGNIKSLKKIIAEWPDVDELSCFSFDAGSMIPESGKSYPYADGFFCGCRKCERRLEV